MTKVEAFFWDENEEPRALPGCGLLDVNVAQSRLLEPLETKEYGKIVKTYSGGELVLYYRAFTDEFRGRQIVGACDLAELDKNYRERKRECDLPVFSPAELYALKPIRDDYENWHTISVHFRDEVDYYDVDTAAVAGTERMVTRTLVDHCSDGRRTWTLQTVWFDGKPVMVVNSSGRDGDEYHNRWITDAEAFAELVKFLHSFTVGRDEKIPFVKAYSKLPAMTEFYGATIHNYYDTEAQEPKKQRDS